MGVSEESEALWEERGGATSVPQGQRLDSGPKERKTDKQMTTSVPQERDRAKQKKGGGRPTAASVPQKHKKVKRIHR